VKTQKAQKAQDTLKAALKVKSARVKAFLNAELGKEIINLLENEFYHGALFDSDPLQTAYNLGRRDVVMYLKELQNWRISNE